MHATKGKAAHARPIPACRIQNLLAFAEDLLKDSQYQAERDSGISTSFYRGRVTAFTVMIEALRDIAQPEARP